jgi:hypothetical protein
MVALKYWMQHSSHRHPATENKTVFLTSLLVRVRNAFEVIMLLQAHQLFATIVLKLLSIRHKHK